MKRIKRVAPVLALVIAGGLLSACDNKEALDKLAGQIEATKGEIAEATKGLDNRLKKGMADLDARIAAAAGKADEAAAAAAANAGKAGALDSFTKSVARGLNELNDRYNASTETLNASIEKNRAQVAAAGAGAKALGASVDKVSAEVGAVTDSVISRWARRKNNEAYRGRRGRWRHQGYLIAAARERRGSDRSGREGDEFA